MKGCWQPLGGALLCLVVGALQGCKAPAVDPFARAQRDEEDGNFLRALIELDRVPPAHRRYAQARALAQALERRVRMSQALLVRGMELRSEWRDKEAIAAFEQALEIWPGTRDARALIRATRNRMSALDQANSKRGAGAVATTSTVGVEPRRPEPTKDGLRVQTTTPVGVAVGEDESTPQPAKPMVEVEPPASRPNKSLSTKPLSNKPLSNRPLSNKSLPNKSLSTKKPQALPTGKRPTAALARVQACLERGDLEAAMDLLEVLHRKFPKDPALSLTLGRVLHQRALLRYGQGFLDGAADDWRRVLELQPKHQQAKAFSRAVEAERRMRRTK